jgi:hypothetical protein
MEKDSLFHRLVSVSTSLISRVRIACYSLCCALHYAVKGLSLCISILTLELTAKCSLCDESVSVTALSPNNDSLTPPSPISPSFLPRSRQFLTSCQAAPIIYMIRHGEKPPKAADGDDVDGLSEQGLDRAQYLPQVFGASSQYNIRYILAEHPKKGLIPSRR